MDRKPTTTQLEKAQTPAGELVIIYGATSATIGTHAGERLAMVDYPDEGRPPQVAWYSSSSGDCNGSQPARKMIAALTLAAELAEKMAANPEAWTVFF